MLKFFEKYWGLLLVFTVNLLLVIIPLFFSNPLESFDAIGHLVNASELRDYFWPWPDGWNLHFLAGFPQGIFYPPLFHWLAASMSFFISLNIAFKIIISLAIGLFPVAVFMFAKHLFKSQVASNFLVVIVSIFYNFDIGIKGNLFSGLFFGMFPQIISLTIFSFYLFFLTRLIHERRGFITTTIFLSLCLLSHLVTGAAALILLLVVLAVFFREKKVRLNIILHSVIGLLITTFWWLPLITNLAYTSGSNASPVSSVMALFIAPFLVAINFLVLRLNHRQKNIFSVLAIFNLTLITGSLLGDFLRLDSSAIHFSRFLIYPFLLTPFSLVYLMVSSEKVNWQFWKLALIGAYVFYCLMFPVAPLGPFKAEILEGVSSKYQSGRIISLGSSSSLDARFHSARMKLVDDYGLPLVDGLFVESSPNGWFIMSLIGSWDKNQENFIWAYRRLRDVSDLSWGSRLFGINYEYRVSDIPPSKNEQDGFSGLEVMAPDYNNNSLSDELLKEERDSYFKLSRERLLDDENIISKLGTNNSGFYYQTFYKVNDTDLAEAVYLPPVNIDSSWDKKIKEWWTTDWLRASSTDYLYDKPLLVYRAPVSSWELSSTPQNFPIISISQRMDSFIVDASPLSSPVPIYVKVGYFPFWKAYSEQGQELEIYRAAPNFMLVYGKGKIIFKYVKPFYYYLGYSISALALAGLAISYLKSKRRKIKEK